MKNKIKILPIFLILFFLSISFASASDIDNQTLNLENLDMISADNANYKSFTELQTTINNAKDGDTLILNDSYINDVYTHAYTLNINKAITLDGNGNTLDGNQMARILNVNTDNVILKNLIFINGKSDNSGAISWGANSGTIENCVFENNSATTYVGGAVTFNGNNGKIIGSTFKSNVAPSSGGAVRIEGNNFLISNNNFEENSANNIGGGMIIIGHRHNISNNNFTSNFADSSGGGLRIEGNNSVITNNIFNKNVAKVNLGGAMISLGNNSYIANNIYTNNIAGRDGGAIDLEGYVISENESIHGTNNTVISNTFKNNSAKYGGAISTYCKETSIIDNEFKDNYASELGGAIRWAGATSTYGMIINNTFNNNSADVSGGAIFASLNKATISGNTFTKHVSTNKNERSGGSGGTITIHGEDNIITDNEFTDSTATRSGGAIYTEGKNVIISENKFKNTNADVTGGAIYAEGDSAKIINNNFDTTIINSNGGSIRLIGNNALISENTIKNAKAEGSGGAMYLDGDTISITNNNIDDATANGASGGAITINGNNNKIDKNTFTNIKSGRIGGVIYSTGNKTNINNNAFKESEAATNGGAIYLTGNAASISENEFENAKAQYGGAIYISSSDSIINNNKFTNNIAEKSGGAINSEGKVTIKNNEFNKNSASSTMGGAVNSNGANSIISDNTFKDNTANTGAAVSSNGKETQITNNIFKNNKAESNGGALRLEGDKSVITDNTFKENTAKGFGAAAYVQGSDITASNNIFTDNAAGSDKIGGALRWSGDNAKITDNTFKGNTAKTGTAIYGSGANTQITGNRMINSKEGDTSIRWDGDNQNIKDNIYIEFNPKTELDLTDVTINYGETGKLTATLTNNNTALARKPVTINFNNKETTATTNAKGQISIDIKGLNVGTYRATATFKGDEEYEASNDVATVTINKAPTKTTITGVKDIKVGENLTNVKVNVNAEGELTIKLNNDVKTVPYTGGDYNLNYYELDEGDYTLTVTYNDKNNNYLSSSANAKFSVTKKTNSLNVKTKDIEEGQDAVFEVTTTMPNGKVTLSIGGRTYNENIVNNKAKFTISNLAPNTYQYTVSTPGDKYYTSADAKGTLKVKSTTLIIDAPDVTKYYHGSERFEVTITDKDGKPLDNINITITINNVPYDKTTGADGKTSIGLNINSGNYTVLVTFKGNDEYNPVNITSNVVIKSTTIGSDVNKIQRGPEQYVATFKNSDGKLINSDTAIFNINGVMYYRTIENGVAKLNLNIEPGQYIITAINPVTGEETGNIITVTPRIVNNSDVVKFFKNGTQYHVTVLDDNGKHVKAGEVVTFNINGVMYQRTTDENGVATLSINLNPNDYIITTTYKECFASNKIKVLPVLSAEDITMKYKSGTQFKATLLDGQGKAFVNQTINFNINGVFYNRTTNDQGVAALNINLMPGQYIITSMSQNGAVISNKITITS